MKKKGQIGIGALVIVFISVIAAVALYQATLPLIGGAVSTTDMTNESHAKPDGTSNVIWITGQDYISDMQVVNFSQNNTLPATNYTIEELVNPTTGVKQIRVTLNEGFSSNGTGGSLLFTYVYGADGYIDSSAGRSMALLIPILAALAIAVFALSPTLRSGIIESFGM